MGALNIITNLLQAIEQKKPLQELEDAAATQLAECISIHDFFQLPLSSIYRIASKADPLSIDLAVNLISGLSMKHGCMFHIRARLIKA